MRSSMEASPLLRHRAPRPATLIVVSGLAARRRQMADAVRAALPGHPLVELSDWRDCVLDVPAHAALAIVLDLDGLPGLPAAAALLLRKLQARAALIAVRDQAPHDAPGGLDALLHTEELTGWLGRLAAREFQS